MNRSVVSEGNLYNLSFVHQKMVWLYFIAQIRFSKHVIKQLRRKRLYARYERRRTKRSSARCKRRPRRDVKLRSARVCV